MLTLVLALLGPSQAAEVTEMPPALRADIDLRYGAALENGSLREQGKDYGRRHDRTHDLLVRAEFSPVEHFAIWLGAEVVLQRSLTFSGAYEMRYDPVTETGTYVGSTPLADSPEVRGGGLDGLWVGAAWRPFVEQPGHGAQTTWRLDAAFRTPNPGSTLYTVNDNGKRGAATGGFGLMGVASMSTWMNPIDAYVRIEGRYETPTKVDVTDASGTVINEGARIDPASGVDLRTGVEIVAYDNAESGSRFATDLFVAFGYKSWQDLPSGIVLPSVLPQSEGQITTGGNFVYGTVGLALVAHITRYVGLRAGASGTYVLPHRLESPYAVVTGQDTVSVGIEAGLTGKIR